MRTLAERGTGGKAEGVVAPVSRRQEDTRRCVEDREKQKRGGGKGEKAVSTRKWGENSQKRERDGLCIGGDPAQTDSIPLMI